MSATLFDHADKLAVTICMLASDWSMGMEASGYSAIRRKWHLNFL